MKKLITIIILTTGAILLSFSLSIASSRTRSQDRYVPKEGSADNNVEEMVQQRNGLLREIERQEKFVKKQSVPRTATVRNRESTSKTLSTRTGVLSRVDKTIRRSTQGTDQETGSTRVRAQSTTQQQGTSSNPSQTQGAQTQNPSGIQVGFSGQVQVPLKDAQGRNCGILSFAFQSPLQSGQSNP